MSTKKEESLRFYEVGFLLVPTIVPEVLETSVSEIIKKPILDSGANVIATENPSLTHLSYPMTKKIGVTNKVFNEGYFGWIKFSTNSDKIEAVKESLAKSNDILRFLLINTVEENTYLGKRASTLAREEGSALRTEVLAGDLPVVAVTEEESKPLNEVEMEKSIEEMTKSA